MFDHHRAPSLASDRQRGPSSASCDSQEEGLPIGKKELSLARPANSSLFVRNVSDRATSDDLREMFRAFGPLFDVYIPRDFYSKRPRGFAYVQYEEPEDAAAAQEKLHHALLYDRRLEVDFAKGDRKTPFEMKAQELDDPDTAWGKLPSRHDHHRHHHRHHRDHHHHHHHHHHHSSSDDHSHHRHHHHRHRSRSREKSRRRHRRGSEERRHRHKDHHHDRRRRHRHRHRRSHSDECEGRRPRSEGGSHKRRRPSPEDRLKGGNCQDKLSSSGRRSRRHRSSSSSSDTSSSYASSRSSRESRDRLSIKNAPSPDRALSTNRAPSPRSSPPSPESSALSAKNGKPAKEVESKKAMPDKATEEVGSFGNPNAERDSLVKWESASSSDTAPPGE